MNIDNPFPQAAPDFTDPLGLLRACHGRIAEHCRILERLVPHLASHGIDTQARQAMARVHHYFSTAAQHHHEDEEADLFPLLAGRDRAVDDLMGELLREHTVLASCWQRLKALLENPERALAPEADLAIVVATFVHGYREHAEKENDHLLPRAAGLLAIEELRTLGRRMAGRRGVAIP